MRMKEQEIDNGSERNDKQCVHNTQTTMKTK